MKCTRRRRRKTCKNDPQTPGKSEGARVRSPHRFWPALWVLGALCAPTCALPAQPAPTADVYELLESGRQALAAEKYPEASQLLEQALAKPEFTQLEPGHQYLGFLFAAFAADGREDHLGAHEFLMAATQFPDADGDTWLRRAQLAALIDNWSDAALALIAVARKWPKTLAQGDHQVPLVMGAVRELGKAAGSRTQRLELLNALFDSGYTMEYDNEPSYLWLDLAADALDRKDIKRARTIARRISSSSVLVAMRIDKRFDALAAENPKLFDVRAAAERDAKHMRKVMGDNPKALDAVVGYGYALYTLGRFDELLALADGVIAKVEKASADSPPYEDLDDQLNWIYNHRASALRAQNKLEEAAAVLASWERSEHNRDDKVSQAINLGFFYNEMGKPEAALKAVDGLDWTRGMSAYGRTQFQFVRFQAYRQLGRTNEMQDVVTWMREHQDDAKETAQSTLLESGDVEGAAALLISRLRDADERAAALAEIQIYEQTFRTERQNELDALQEKLLARADVVTAVAQYGRREKFPIYSLEY